jgi:putative transcriptional regulator
LLVASRALEQTPFSRTVVLILQANNDGTFGVILNRPADSGMIEAWEQASKSPQHVRSHLACGGPMGGPVFAVHHNTAVGEIKIADGLFVTASAEALGKLFVGPDQSYRVFMGIAGWRKGQLEDEVTRGCWYLLDRRPGEAIANPEHLWERSLIQYGRDQLCDILDLPEIQGNPLWN